MIKISERIRQACNLFGIFLKNRQEGVIDSATMENISQLLQNLEKDTQLGNDLYNKYDLDAIKHESRFQLIEERLAKPVQDALLSQWTSEKNIPNNRTIHDAALALLNEAHLYRLYSSCFDTIVDRYIYPFTQTTRANPPWEKDQWE